MEPVLVSTLAVALAEMGDKTQLLALVLAVRFRAPLAVCLGILVATLANHAAAAFVGTLAADALTGAWLRWAVGLSFLAMAGWTLIPDKLDDAPSVQDRFGAFLATTIAFFLVEIGDKTQIATVALAARFDSVLMVTIGTTVGMLLANVPVVLGGDALAKRVNFTWLRYAAAALFAALGIAILIGVGL
ncbi:MAG: TMEM165/GDT1 family protein [Alphaproteobacteria bacterium]|nr:MAG: TMEM165/GDT1 family protein [Alphaproteobacteria bacterium]